MIELITPFLAQTTAIMTTVLLLMFSNLWLIIKKKDVKRATVEGFMSMTWKAILVLVCLEGILTVIHFAEDWMALYFKYKMS